MRRSDSCMAGIAIGLELRLDMLGRAISGGMLVECSVPVSDLVRLVSIQNLIGRRAFHCCLRSQLQESCILRPGVPGHRSIS